MVTEIRTPRMLLRSLSQDDRDEFVRVHGLSEAFFRLWFPLREGTPGDLFRLEMEKVERGRNDGSHLRWVGVLEDGRIAGFFNLGEVVRGVFQNAYASWSVSVEVAGQGYATEGVTALLDLAFAPNRGVALHRVQANIIPSNQRSIRLAERVGFRREGLAERYLQIAGAWQDHLMYAKTAEEHALRYLG